MIARFLFMAAWVVAPPAAIGGIALGLVLLSGEGPSVTALARVVGAPLLASGIAISVGMARWILRMRRGARLVSELPEGESFDRVRLAVPTGPCAGPLQSEGPYGVWLDVGSTNLLIHVGMRYRAIVPRSQLQARLRRRWWGKRLELAFDPPAQLIRFGRPFVATRILLPAPETSDAMGLVHGSRDVDDVGEAGASQSETEFRDSPFDTLMGILAVAFLVVVVPWAGYAVGRGIARWLSEDPGVRGIGTYVIVAAIAWVFVGLLLWVGARRERYDFEEAAGWLVLIAPVLAFVVAIPLGFLFTA